MKNVIFFRYYSKLTLLQGPLPVDLTDHKKVRHTCLCAQTTEPRSFQVPPRRSMRTMRRIWKKRRPRRAEAANTCPEEPMPSTTSDAKIVVTSVHKNKFILLSNSQYYLPNGPIADSSLIIFTIFSIATNFSAKDTSIYIMCAC